MPDYYEAPDGYGEPCIWTPNADKPDYPFLVMGQRDVLRQFWPDVVARMTGATITTDDATVETVAKAITPHYFTPTFGEHAREQAREAARNVLAALTGVPHD